MPLKRMAGIDEWGARTRLCVPIGAHMGRPQKGKIHPETKRGLDRGLVSVLYTSTVHEHELYLFDQQWSFFSFQRWWAADVRYNNKVRAFLSCTNPAETGRTREVRHVSIRSKRNKKGDRQGKKIEITVLHCAPSCEQSVLRYTIQFVGSRVFVKLFGQNFRCAETTRKEKQCHACRGM
jgi:hypothetical protein